jgi:hypothetical protein
VWRHFFAIESCFFAKKMKVKNQVNY